MSAEEITNIDLTDYFRRRFGNPYAVVHRGDLHGIFVRACEAHANVTLRTDCDVVGYEQNGAQASALLKSGERVTGCLLIGADGLRSRIRQQMVGDGAPRIAGHTTYRSVIPTEQMPEDLRWNAATLWAGAKCHLVHYPLSGWKVFNLAITCHNDPAEAFAARPVTHEEVLAGFRDVHPRAKAIIHHGRDWKAWVTSDRDPTDRWVDGRVVLLGDAAHPMLQDFAQGACMALEDAIWLAEELDERKGDIAHALDRYRNARLLRTARVQLQAGSSALTSIIRPASTRCCAISSFARPAWSASARTWPGSIRIRSPSGGRTPRGRSRNPEPGRLVIGKRLP
ncbi:FAD-dependent monooxygenase [Bradyrhizobium japonicum]